MPNYCEECNGEILDVKNNNQLNKALIQALLVTFGARISPMPTYCRCSEGLPPLEIENRKVA